MKDERADEYVLMTATNVQRALNKCAERTSSSCQQYGMLIEIPETDYNPFLYFIFLAAA
jgi:hypothetical protein